VHRIGRAGRFGSEAIAINFCSEADLEIKELAKFPEKTSQELVELIETQLKRGASSSVGQLSHKAA